MMVRGRPPVPSTVSPRVVTQVGHRQWPPNRQSGPAKRSKFGFKLHNADWFRVSATHNPNLACPLSHSVHCPGSAACKAQVEKSVPKGALLASLLFVRPALACIQPAVW